MDNWELACFVVLGLLAVYWVWTTMDRRDFNMDLYSNRPQYGQTPKQRYNPNDVIVETIPYPRSGQPFQTTQQVVQDARKPDDAQFQKIADLFDLSGNPLPPIVPGIADANVGDASTQVKNFTPLAQSLIGDTPRPAASWRDVRFTGATRAGTAVSGRSEADSNSRHFDGSGPRPKQYREQLIGRANDNRLEPNQRAGGGLGSKAPDVRHMADMMYEWAPNSVSGLDAETNVYSASDISRNNAAMSAMRGTGGLSPGMETRGPMPPTDTAARGHHGPAAGPWGASWMNQRMPGAFGSGEKGGYGGTAPAITTDSWAATNVRTPLATPVSGIMEPYSDFNRYAGQDPNPAPGQGGTWNPRMVDGKPFDAKKVFVGPDGKVYTGVAYRPVELNPHLDMLPANHPAKLMDTHRQSVMRNNLPPTERRKNMERISIKDTLRSRAIPKVWGNQ